jgi:dimethylamine/trimethylamine dehydrogenase
VFSADDVMAGELPNGPVVVYDDDHYYLGGVIAEKLRHKGREVTLVTPANEVSTWTTHTEEQYRIQQRVLQLGINIETGTTLAAIAEHGVELECIYTERTHPVDAAGVVMVTSRVPHAPLYEALVGRIDIARIGDCIAPGTIATAVYSGHECAREMDTGTPADVRFRREHAQAPR